MSRTNERNRNLILPWREKVLKKNVFDKPSEQSQMSAAKFDSAMARKGAWKESFGFSK